MKDPSDRCELLVTIARCPNVTAARLSPTHPCCAIVRCQRVPLDEHHIPEPWNGSLREAPLLFVSSNPAIDEGEDYPRDGWGDDAIKDYFTNRFGDGRKEWTLDENKALQLDGTYGRRSQFWSSIRARARELFGREVSPGRDYALTEVVHCKSLGEQGVKQAADECSARYLLPVLEASAASIIVALGSVAEKYLRRIGKFETILGIATVGGRERLIAVLPHPNARGFRSFARCFNRSDLDTLRKGLAEMT